MHYFLYKIGLCFASYLIEKPEKLEIEIKVENKSTGHPVYNDIG